MSYSSIQDRIKSLRRVQPSSTSSSPTAPNGGSAIQIQRYNRGSLRSRFSHFQVHETDGDWLLFLLH